MRAYPPLPQPPQRADSEPAALYGQRLVLWLLADGVPSVLSDDDLELASYAAASASATQGYSVPVYNTISRMRHAIAGTIAARARLDDTAAVRMAGGQSPHVPNVGPMAPLEPAPIVQPPSPAYAWAGGTDRKYDDIAF